ncbi:MAG: hypothetical protein JST85_19915 [Acidobacteria bacterium]|nr:hypothetical protein [Acidobacteriota bacterium]
MHLAGTKGGYSDYDLAVAMSKVVNLTASEQAELNKLTPLEKDRDASSIFWDKFLIDACPRKIR